MEGPRGKGGTPGPEDNAVPEGKYHLGSVNITAIPAVDGEERRDANIGPDDRILVSDRMLDMRRLRESRILNRLPMPTRSVGAIGSETTDFKEIRKYGQGDRYRSINWKATARAGEGSIPLVNQYETEGRLSVLILLDNGPSMSTAAGGARPWSMGSMRFSRCPVSTWPAIARWGSIPSTALPRYTLVLAGGRDR